MKIKKEIKWRPYRFQKQKKTRKKSGFFRYWWVVLFLLLCQLIYSRAVLDKNLQKTQLAQNMLQLKQKIDVSFTQQEELSMRIQSQNDPEWVKMILMKKLGVVPEGQVKVYFTQ